jgi:hypothetical protein
VRHPGLGNITNPGAKRRTDVLERLTLGVRSLRLGHRHDRRQVISPLSYLRKLGSRCNTCLKTLMSAFVIFFVVVSIDDRDIDEIDEFVKTMPDCI